MIRQRILGASGTFVVLSFLSHSSSKEYTCVCFYSLAFMRAFSLQFPVLLFVSESNSFADQMTSAFTVARRPFRLPPVLLNLLFRSYV